MDRGPQIFCILFFSLGEAKMEMFCFRLPCPNRVYAFVVGAGLNLILIICAQCWVWKNQIFFGWVSIPYTGQSCWWTNIWNCLVNNVLYNSPPHKVLALLCAWLDKVIFAVLKRSCLSWLTIIIFLRQIIICMKIFLSWNIGYLNNSIWFQIVFPFLKLIHNIKGSP